MAFDDEIVEESKAMAYSQGTGLNQRLIDMVLSKPDHLLLQALESRSRKPAAGQALLEYSRALFVLLGPSARRSDSSRSAALLLRLVIKLLNLVQDVRVSADRKFTECLEFALQELDALPRKSLPHIVESILHQMERPNFAFGSDADDAQTLLLLPRCLSLIAASSQHVEVPGSDENVTSDLAGSEYLNRALKRMLSLTPWSKPALLKITSMLREMPLSESYLLEFLNAIFTQMQNVEPIEYPAIVYQLLLLASKGSMRNILLGILAFFSHSFSVSSEVSKSKGPGKKSSAESCRQVEGTILLHINFAVKQNPALGQEILNLVRSRCFPLTSFIFSVFLSLARIQRFEEIAMNLLKAAATKAYQDWKLSRYSSSLPSGLKKQCLEDVTTLEQAIMKTVQNTAFGWDHVIPSLVNFGFTMIETAAEASLCDHAAKSSQLPSCKDLGAKILRTTFEVHELARDEIIEQSKCRIIGLKPEQSLPIIRMVGQLVQDYPRIMLEHVSRLKECLDYYAFLHPTSASSLFGSIGPLFQLSSDLQGYAVLVLRKAMFGKEATARINALQGLVNLLIAERASKAQNDLDSLLNSSNEASCSQQEHSYFRKTPSLLHELKGLLRRCLSQQAKIRELLYKGLIKLVLVDPTAADIAFNLLWPHFCRYYKFAENSNILLDLGGCLRIQSNSVLVEEPLDHLIFSIHNLLTLQPQEEEGHNTFSEPVFDFSLSQDLEVGRMPAASSLRDAFLNVRKKFIHGSLSDLSMDKSQDFSAETLEGRINLEKAHMYLGIYEILVDSIVSELAKHPSGSSKGEAEKDLLCCISMYYTLEETVQKHASSPGNRLRPLESSISASLSVKLQSGFMQNFETKMPFLSAANSLYLLQYAQNSEGLEISRNTHVPTSQRNDQESVQKDIMGYRYRIALLATRTCLRRVKGAASASVAQCEDPWELKELGGDWKILGKPILEALSAAVTTSSGVFSWSVERKERVKQGRGKKPTEEGREGLVLMLVKCLDEIWRLAQRKNCIIEVFGQASTNHQEKDLMEENEGGCNNLTEATSEQMFSQELLSKKIQPLLEQLLRRSQFREFEVLSGITLGLGSRLHSLQMKAFGLWAEANCKTLKLTFNGAVKALMKIAVCLLPPPDDLVLAHALSQELLKVIGTDEQEPIEISGTYHVINASTKNCIAGSLLQHVESILTNADWLISKLKLPPSAKSDLSTDLLTQPHFEVSRMESEVALHKRLEILVLVLSNFVQMNLTGAVAEQFLRVSVRLYKCLAATTKLCIAPKGYKQTVPSDKFQMLAEVTCKKLTAPLYNFMAVMQRDQQENCQTKGAVNKIKREVRTIPNLVFHVEDYERYLIQLSRLTKVNFLRHAKRSTARDFKILDNGKKCKQPAANENMREEAAEPDAAAEDSEREGSREEQESEEEQNGSQGDVNVQDEDEEEEAPSIRFRRPMEKRGRKTVVRDSDDEAEGNKRQHVDLWLLMWVEYEEVLQVEEFYGS
ncbi:hypothetical protein GOP47_0001621 [Adiantum capillus-veneris]|uniref:Fanconi anemia group I protein n=1 Tax=Adiantum capillus-veneris TaxID=13818 RepID=A0A9D4ZN88_ADICA|nr:hypothetical protein GOP47_0001621 [Adiantum capillus-veneris]